MRIANMSLLAALILFAPGCLIVDHEEPGCYGDGCTTTIGNFGFWWSFELQDGSLSDSCAVADVARIDVRVYDDWGDLEYVVLDRPCNDLGLDLLDFYTGYYDLQLTGRCPLGRITHEGWYEVYVGPGPNELGVLSLDYLGPCL